MKNYLDNADYLKLTEELKALVEKRIEPTTSYHYAFSYAYDGNIKGEPMLRLYSNYLMRFPQCTVKDLHAFCLGFGTSTSVLETLTEDDIDIETNIKNDKKTFH